MGAAMATANKQQANSKQTQQAQQTQQTNTANNKQYKRWAKSHSVQRLGHESTYNRNRHSNNTSNSSSSSNNSNIDTARTTCHAESPYSYKLVAVYGNSAH